MNGSPALRLDDRVGLPDDIAFLRPDYPRRDWRAHANFGHLADFWLQVHTSLRHESSDVSRVVDAFRNRQLGADEFQDAFTPRLNGFLQHLAQHHRIEDDAYFPKFRRLDERLVIGFDLLEADHKLIHERLVATVEHARRMIGVLSSPAASQAAETYAVEAEVLLDFY